MPLEATKRYVVGISGASGAVYGLRLIAALLARPVTLYAAVTPAGRQVMGHETGLRELTVEGLRPFCAAPPDPEARLEVCEAGDLFAPPASGSFRHDGMAVAPCSMRTLAAVAGGLAGDLIPRAADVCLKERRPLVLVTRETPLSPIHLANMRRAAAAGAVILPASPGFYGRPQTIADLVDTVVARVLDHLGVPHLLGPRWGEDHAGR